jgi:hypothetical protein
MRGHHILLLWLDRVVGSVAMLLWAGVGVFGLSQIVVSLILAWAVLFDPNFLPPQLHLSSVSTVIWLSAASVFVVGAILISISLANIRRELHAQGIKL